MKNNCFDASKANSKLNKKESNLNFKQALSKKFSKKSNINSKQEKEQQLKQNKKQNTKKSKEVMKNHVKPYLTKNEIKINCKQKTSEKIQNLLKNVNHNNNASNNNFNSKNKKHFKNKSTTHLCNPGSSASVKNANKQKDIKFNNNKSPELNDFIIDNKEINNQDFNNNNNLLKTNLAFLIAKNQNYDDDSVFLNINESYIDYINNIQQLEIQRRNIKNDYMPEDFSIKNGNNDNNNNDTNSFMNSIININKYLSNEVNHKAVNDTSAIDKKKKKSKPRKVYENQLSKSPFSKDINKIKEESKNTNNENDKNLNNIKNNNINTISCGIDNDNNNNNMSMKYQKELLNKVLKSKFAYTGQKISKNYLIKKRKFLYLEDSDEENNKLNIITYNTHSPKNTISHKIIKNFQISPNICNFNKTLFNINSDLIDKMNNNYPKERIKVSKAKKYQNDGNNNESKIKNKKGTNGQKIKDIKEEQYDKSTKSNNTNSLSSNKTNGSKINNNNKKINEFNLINENVNNIITKNNNINNIENNNKEKNYNIFDDDFYRTFEIKSDGQNEDNIDRKHKSQLNKYISYIDNFPKKKINNIIHNLNSSCQFISPSMSDYKKYNTLLIKEKNNIFNINNSNIDYYNNEYLYTQEDDNNNSKIQEIKIQLKSPTNLNSSIRVGERKHLIKIHKMCNSNPNINVLNVKNSTINICKNKYNIVEMRNDDVSDKKNKNSNFNCIYKNQSRSISSIIRNKNKIYAGKSPSHRCIYQTKNENKDNKDNFDYLNNSNDKLMNQQIYTRQIFNNNIINIHNVKSSKNKDSQKIFQQKDDKNKIGRKNIHNLLNTESNKLNHVNKFNNQNNLNMNILSPMNKYHSPELEFKNMENIVNPKKNEKNEKIKNIFDNNNFYTTEQFFHKDNKDNDEINLNPAPKIYIKPSKYIFKKSNITKKNKSIKFSSPLVSSCLCPSSNKNIYSTKGNKSPIITSYRYNIDEYKKNKNNNYFDDIEFINNTNTNLKIKNNLYLYDMNKSTNKAYIKKNKDINYNKKNNNKLLLKNKVTNNINNKITKLYNYYISKTQIIKKPFYCSKYKKKPKHLPICKWSFMTKIIYQYFKKIKNDICYIDKIVVKNKNNENNDDMNSTKNNVKIESNIIKANILDFSLEQNKENTDDYKSKKYFNNDNNYHESVGDIHLSFSIDDTNTFKCKESTIEAVFNELNNVNNDSEIKVTFGPENVNHNNYNNYEISTDGRMLNDSFNDSKSKKILKIPKISRIYKRDEILKNIDKKCEKISSVIIYDNQEENEDIKINLDINRENMFYNEEKEEDYQNQSYRDDDFILNIKSSEVNNLKFKSNKVDTRGKNDLNDDKDLNNDRKYMKNNIKKTITSKDVINFTEKLENIFDKKKFDSIDIKDNIEFIDDMNYNILDDYNKKIPRLTNDEFINTLEQKWKTYVPKNHIKNKYLDILSNNDLSPLHKLEKRINHEKNDFFKENNNNSINETESENENNITFSQNKNNTNQDMNIENEIIYILNIISINNFTYLIEDLSNIILKDNNSDINEHKYLVSEKQRIFVDILINKSYADIQYSFLYAIICKNLNSILSEKENDLNIGQNQNNNDNLINIIKNKIWDIFNECIEKITNDMEIKHKLFGIIYTLVNFIDIEIELIESGFDYIDAIYNNYLNNSNNSIKYILLECLLFLLNKFGKIIYYKKDEKNIENINNFINDKIKLLKEDKNLTKINKHLITKIINLTENEWKITVYQEFRINKYKKIIMKHNTNEENNENENDILNNNINYIDYYYPSDIDYETLILIKQNLINYNSDNNNINEDQYTNLNKNYKIEIFTIIICYIEICIDYIDNISLINNCNNYINNIIENYSTKDKKNENDENKIINLILNIDYIIMDNKYMYQIMGYLLYSLINYEIYKIEDLDKFIGKEEQTLINIAKVIKYIIIYCNKDFVGDDYKTKILEEFKKTKLFKTNQKIIDFYVINDDYLL